MKRSKVFATSEMIIIKRKGKWCDVRENFVVWAVLMRCFENRKREKLHKSVELVRNSCEFIMMMMAKREG
jgi:hypothetical protein